MGRLGRRLPTLRERKAWMIATTVRFPPSLREQLIASASENGRSLSAEILMRLEGSLRDDQVRVAMDQALQP